MESYFVVNAISADRGQGLKTLQDSVGVFCHSYMCVIAAALVQMLIILNNHKLQLGNGLIN